ncbi:cobalt-zinc-cadmium efflux system membrane fusion protein [Sphingomonas sp. PP-F2F-A104-K0414]|uniref:efflux RND transporter periplasmic adaptor subunit n=1 Tax=Sphingomonas sp. PP-F2F-A104-K0414 TaxID=2135661 RepID=UPI00104A8D36|nr:efflux RND transporter periplasmic adaptor subunit [Sphingomonas sp. PP-F2F-A104-K0414]TCP96089.1 cobalt-zinc-cadmium efflux system membrane fusion protein [Sphingomonas sp. PP-F2F-A104-K0414]
MNSLIIRAIAPVVIALAIAGCGQMPEQATNASAEARDETGNSAGDPAVATLSVQQIADAGIEVTRPTVGGVAGAIELPATIEGDPQGVQVISAPIGGRLVSLTRNLGQSIGHGQTLAIIESREAASLNAEVEAAGARSALAQSNLRREQRLFAERVSPEQDLVAARTAATEASIALRLARQQLSATGGGGGGGGALNRIAVHSPITGQVIARSATLGQQVAADVELFRVANLAKVSVTMSLVPADAGRVKPGARVEVTSAGRRQDGRVTFVSPILDETTRLVPVIATIDNATGTWRVGENVGVSVLLPASGDRSVAVPSAAVQMIGDRPHVFVRTATGFRATPVTLGRTNGGAVSVTAGLTGEERIASTNSFTLKAELGKSAAKDED